MKNQLIKQNGRKSILVNNIVLAVMAAGLVFIPLIINKSSDFTGTDDKAKDYIIQINANYKPWFSPIWEPPSDSVESLIFSIQAAIGAGIVGYGLGYLKGKNKKS